MATNWPTAMNMMKMTWRIIGRAWKMSAGSLMSASAGDSLMIFASTRSKMTRKKSHFSARLSRKRFQSFIRPVRRANPPKTRWLQKR
jgi:hypothetical protein